MITWCFHVCHRQSPRIRCDDVPFSAFDCKYNVRTSIRKCTRMHDFEMEKNQKFSREGAQPPSPDPSPVRRGAPLGIPFPHPSLRRFRRLDPHCFFWEIEHWLHVSGGLLTFHSCQPGSLAVAGNGCFGIGWKAGPAVSRLAAVSRRSDAGRRHCSVIHKCSGM